jgi:beta-lactamase regulating signal transducer with metallopeptidase domain
MPQLSALLLTYLLHSSVLLAAAAALRLLLRERQLVLQEAVLRAALLGAFVTAGLQSGLGLAPLGGVLVATAPSTPVAAEPRELAAKPSPATAEAATLALPSRPLAAADHAGLERPSWQAALVALWGLLSLIGLTRLAVAAAGLRRLLDDRQPLADAELRSTARLFAARLGLRKAVLLTTSRRLSVPLSTGVLGAEVCLPGDALAALAEGERTALCAHELAHLARRDPAWILLTQLAVALAPLQPLNLWARRRLGDLAECLADDLAITASGERTGLARSLLEVAGWMVSRPIFPLSVAAGASGARSGLGHRLERIMDPVRLPERPRRALLPLAAGLVLATALVTPVVIGSPRAQEAEPAEAPEMAAPDVEAPDVEAPEAEAPEDEATEEEATEAEATETEAAETEATPAPEEEAPLVPAAPMVRTPPVMPRTPTPAAAPRVPPPPPPAPVVAAAPRARTPRPAVAAGPAERAAQLVELTRVQAETEAAVQQSVTEAVAHLEKVKAEIRAMAAEQGRAIAQNMKEMAEAMARMEAKEMEKHRRMTEDAVRVEVERFKRDGQARGDVELRQAVEELERAVAETRRAADEARKAAEEARRAADQVRRAGAKESKEP